MGIWRQRSPSRILFLLRLFPLTSLRTPTSPSHLDAHGGRQPTQRRRIRVALESCDTLRADGADFGITIVPEVDPALEVTDATTSSNVTLTFDVRSWFTASDGSLVDPATAGDGGANADLVAENIRASLRGFEDADHDGHEDSEDGPDSTGG